MPWTTGPTGSPWHGVNSEPVTPINTTRVLGVIAIVYLWVSGCGGGSGSSKPAPSATDVAVPLPAEANLDGDLSLL